MNLDHITIDEYWWNMIAGVVIPLLVALIKKRFASGAVGAMILLFLSALTEAIRVIIGNDGHFELKQAVVGLVMTFLTAVGAHFGLWKPAAVTGDHGAILKAVPGGVGSPEPSGQDRFER